MANFIFNNSRGIYTGGSGPSSAIQFDAAALKIILLRTTTGIDADLGASGTLTVKEVINGAGDTGYSASGGYTGSAAECSDSNATYTRKALGSATVTVDDTNDRVDIDFGNVTWTALASAAASGGDIAGMLIYEDASTDDGANYPIAFIDSIFPITPNGGDVTFNIANLFRLTDPGSSTDWVFNIGKRYVGRAYGGLTSFSAVNILLLTDNTGVDRDADTLAAAIASATEASTSGTNYTRKALTSAAWSVDETNDRADFDYGDVSYTGLNCGTVTGAIVYGVIAGGDANCIPLSFHTTGFPLITNGGNVTITINGLWRSS